MISEILCEKPKIELYQGDCKEVLKNIDNKFDLVIADPPYGIDLDTEYSKYPTKLKYDKIIGDSKPFDFTPFKDISCKEQFWFGAENYLKIPFAGSWFCWYKYPTDKNHKRIAGEFEMIWTKERHKRIVLKIKGINTNWISKNERVGHPTQKPLELIKYLVERFSDENDTILDPFAGSGTTGVVCKLLNRNCIMMEMAPKYCDIVRKRIKSTYLTEKYW